MPTEQEFRIIERLSSLLHDERNVEAIVVLLDDGRAMVGCVGEKSENLASIISDIEKRHADSKNKTVN